MEIDWNGDEIEAALVEGFYRANEPLGNAFQQQINTSKWDWPRETERRKGTVTSPRNIIDIGDLFGSYKPERVRNARAPAYDHAWTAGHAMLVHEGSVTTEGTKLPARPWTDEPLEKGVFEKAFQEYVKRTLGNIR